MVAKKPRFQVLSPQERNREREGGKEKKRGRKGGREGRKLFEEMDILISFTTEITSLCICISKHHVSHFNIHNFIF